MRLLSALALYTGLTILLTWPLSLHLRSVDPGDSAFFAWVTAWELHALTSDPARLPHANIFHPERYVLGMDEPVLGTTLLVLPFRLFTSDLLLLFNLARLLTFVVSALAAYGLARELECGEAPALVAGAAFAFSPIRTAPIAHLSVLGTQWLPFVPLFLVRFARSGRPRDAAAAGLAYVLTAWACGYHAVSGLFILPLTALPLVWGRWRLLPRAVPALGLAAAGLIPLYALHRAALDPQGFVRSEAETVLYSASFESFLAASPWNRLYGELTSGLRGSGCLFPGLIVTGLAVSGAAAAWRARRLPSRPALALAAMAAASAAFALGPSVRAAGMTLFPGPLALLRAIAPVFERIRVPYRAGVYLALALAVLAALALRRWRDRPLRVAAIGAAVLAEGAMIPIPVQQQLQVVDSRRPLPAVYQWLAAQPGEFALLELPILPIDAPYLRPRYHESIYMVRSTSHWKRLVNGYAGIEPESYRRVRHESQGFPSAACLDLLERTGVRYVVLHRGGYTRGRWARIEAALPQFAGRLREVARFGRDGADEIVLEVRAAPAAPALGGA